MSADPEKSFHVVQFPRPMEAAAFVAALSRFLNSPQAGSSTRAIEAIEVWHALNKQTDRVSLYLSDEALRLAQDAFATVAVAEVIGFGGLPPHRAIVVKGGRTAAMGIVDAEALLAARPRPMPLGLASFRTPGPS